MEWVPWDDMLAASHPVLDGDHKILVALFNQLTDSVNMCIPESDYISGEVLLASGEFVM